MNNTADFTRIGIAVAIVAMVLFGVIIPRLASANPTHWMEEEFIAMALAGIAVILALPRKDAASNDR